MSDPLILSSEFGNKNDLNLVLANSIVRFTGRFMAAFQKANYYFALDIWAIKKICGASCGMLALHITLNENWSAVTEFRKCFFFR